MLSEAEVAQYHRDGFIIPDFRLPKQTINDIRDAHSRLLERHPEFVDYCPSLLAYDTGFLNYARIPEIVSMVRQVAGEDLALWNASFFAKPAGTGKRTPWHQDGEYWPIRPLATCTVWIAVDAATPENGCLRVIRGSHKDSELKPHRTIDEPGAPLNQELHPDAFDENEAVDLVLEEGQISLHDVYLLHGSEANTSPNSRRGMTLRFMPTTSLFDRDVAHEMHKSMDITDHSYRTLYLMSGVDRHGGNDFTVRL